MIPDGWNSTYLGKLSSLVTSGSRDWAQYYADSGALFIRMTNLPRDGIRLKLDDLKYVNIESDSNDGKRTKLEINDILISITAELGKIGYIEKDLGLAFINQHMALVRINPIKANPKFIAYLLSFSPQNRLIQRHNDAGAKAGLNLPTIRKFPLVIPKVEEQQKIAQILSTWDQAIETVEAMIEKSTLQKKALMQQLLTGEKRLKGFAGEFKRVHIKDVANIDSQSLTGKTPADYKFRYISLSNVNRGYISANLEIYTFSGSPSRARRIVKKGDVLISTVRPNLQAFARIGKKHADCIASTGFSVLTPKGKNSGLYLYHYLYSSHITAQLHALVVGTNYPAINSSDVGGLVIYCPDYKDQDAIANVLEAADIKIKKLNQQLENLQQQKKSLMQQLLTGKRRVRLDEAADREPALEEAL